MKTTAILLLALTTTLLADEATYKAKCVACHGADGAKNAKKDLSSKAVQDKTDDELVKFLTTNTVHKTKVTSPDQAKSVVKHLRTLKK